MFHSSVFATAVPHRFELTRNLRQDQASERFLVALGELRAGHCSEATEAYLKSLSRPIQGDGVHIYFRKLAVELHNIEVLRYLPGQLITLDSVDKKMLLELPVLLLKSFC